MVALGGGHGLAVTLRALRRVTDQLTAVVGVSDDGGSSGRLRKEFGVPPPGDLRMALAALCGDDTWGRTWSQVVQHRFAGHGELQGHALGNLLITALWEETGDIVEGLDWVAALLGAHGRVLPVSLEPLEIVAQVRGLDPVRPGDVATVRGQVEIARTLGHVTGLTVEPPDAAACLQALQALEQADLVVLGPGSWFTSVLPHLRLPAMAAAVADSPGRRVLILNLAPQPGETAGFAPETHLEVWAEQFPEVCLDVVLADPARVPDVAALQTACRAVGARLVLERVADTRTEAKHDADLLAAALGSLTPAPRNSGGRMRPWR